jgi:hypothetical protein
MVVKVTILASNYGDKTSTMTLQQFQQKYADKTRWAIFAEDKANPENTYKLDSAQNAIDGQDLTVVPQIAGG